jgi:hypothetical protein
MRCVFVLILLAAISLCLPAGIKRLIHSFHSKRLSIDLPVYEQWDLPSLTSKELNDIFSQPFEYLNRGSQAFVYASSAFNVVLKLFIFDTDGRVFDRVYRRIRPQVQSRAKETLDAHMMAFAHVPKETGLLYLHLNPTREPILADLRGPAWHRQKLDLRTVRFVVQKRAAPMDQELSKAYKDCNWSRFRDLLDEWIALLHCRKSRGISNRDPTLFDHFGLVDGRVIEIDCGNYEFCQDSSRFEAEFGCLADRLIHWAELHTPEWKDGVVLHIKEDL